MPRIIAQFSLIFMPFFVLYLGCHKAWIRKERDETQLMSPRIMHGQMNNGVKYFLMQNKTPGDRCFLRLNVENIGSFVEEKNQSGMAHFIEHMAFLDRSLSADVSLGEWLQKNGIALGPHANAFTGSDYTVYMIDLPNCEEQSIKNALRLFRSFADGLVFEDVAIAREKNIIDAEERERSNPQAQLAKRLINALYSGTPYASRPVLGSRSSRSTFTQKMLVDFYQQWYRPENLSVILVGDYDPSVKPDELVINAFLDMKAKTTKKKLPPITDPDYRTPAFVQSDKDMAHLETVFSIQTKHVVKPKFRRELAKKRLAFLLALLMLKNTYAVRFLEQEGTAIRETSIDGYFFDDNVYELSLNVASKPEDLEKAFAEAFLVLREAEMLGFDDQAFFGAQRNFIDSLDQQVMEEQTLGSVMWTEKILDHSNKLSVAQSAIQYQAFATPILREITKKDCQKALKDALRSGHEYIFAMGPIDETPDNVARLKELLKNLKAKKIEAKNAPAIVSFRYEMPDCKDLVPASHHDSSVDIFKYALQNDTKVLLKKTDFKKDEIVIKVITDEGYVSMDERAFAMARVAKSALLEGGLFLHTPDEVVKLLQDKQMSVKLDIFDDRIETSLKTRNRDVRFVLELVRAFITEPLYSETMLNRLKEQIKLHFVELEHNIAKPLHDDFLKAITNNDYRAGLSKPEHLLSVTREELLAWHKKYISSKKLTIVVVGDIDTNALVKDLNCILGNLPKKMATKTRKIVPLKFMTGIDKTYQIVAKNEASLIAVRYPLNFRGKVYPDHGLQILQDIVQEKLRLKLREKRQRTYAPSAIVMENKNPVLQNWLDVTVATKKDEAEETRKDIKQILNKLAIKGITNKDLDKAREPYLTQMKEALTDNDYWAAILANNFAETDSLKWVVTMVPDIKSITSQNINQILRKYFHSKNTSSAVITPLPQ